MQYLNGDHFWQLGIKLAVRLLVAAGILFVLVPHGVPDPLVGALERAEAAAQREDYRAVAGAYRRAYLYQPWHLPHLENVIEAEIQGHLWRQAEQDLMRLQDSRPLTMQEQRWLGEVYLGQRREIEAIATWESVWEAGGIEPEQLAQLADLYRQRGDVDAERRALEALAGRGAADAGQFVRLGLLQAIWQPGQATETLARAAALSPERASRLAPVLAALDKHNTEPPEQWYTRLGVALFRMEEWALAEQALELGTTYNLAYGEAVAYLAYVRARQGKPALSAAAQAVSVSPLNPVVHYLRGLVWRQLERPHDAQLSFERAFSLDSDNPAYAVEAASAHRAQNQLQIAELWMQEAVRLADGAFEFELLLVQFYVDEEYRVAEKGLPLALGLVERAPENAEARAVLAWAYFLTGDLDAAFAQIDRALELAPDLPRALFHKGAMLASQNRAEEALTYYQRAVEVAPRSRFGVLAGRAIERLQ